MTSHAFARVAGFRIAVVPRAPFRIRRASEPADAIDVEHFTSAATLFARVIPDNGGYRSKISQHTDSLYDVVEIEPGPETDHWRIETSAFVCGWPEEYALCSNRFPADPAPFDLLGRNGELIFIQQPQSVPDVADMAGPGQTMVHMAREADTAWIELAYDQEGVPWWQRHQVVHLAARPAIVTVQAPLEFREAATAAAGEVARSLQDCDIA